MHADFVGGLQCALPVLVLEMARGHIRVDFFHHFVDLLDIKYVVIDRKRTLTSVFSGFFSSPSLNGGGGAPPVMPFSAFLHCRSDTQTRSPHMDDISHLSIPRRYINAWKIRDRVRPRAQQIIISPQSRKTPKDSPHGTIGELFDA